MSSKGSETSSPSPSPAPQPSTDHGKPKAWLRGVKLLIKAYTYVEQGGESSKAAEKKRNRIGHPVESVRRRIKEHQALVDTNGIIIPRPGVGNPTPGPFVMKLSCPLCGKHFNSAGNIRSHFPTCAKRTGNPTGACWNQNINYSKRPNADQEERRLWGRQRDGETLTQADRARLHELQHRLLDKAEAELAELQKAEKNDSEGEENDEEEGRVEGDLDAAVALSMLKDSVDARMDAAVALVKLKSGVDAKMDAAIAMVLLKGQTNEAAEAGPSVSHHHLQQSHPHGDEQALQGDWVPQDEIDSETEDDDNLQGGIDYEMEDEDEVDQEMDDNEIPQDDMDYEMEDHDGDVREQSAPHSPDLTNPPPDQIAQDEQVAREAFEREVQLRDARDGKGKA